MDIIETRNCIDRTDEDLVQLIVRRMDLANEEAKCRQKAGNALHDGLRDREVIKHVMRSAGDDHSQYMHVIYNTILEVSRSSQYSNYAYAGRTAGEISAAMETMPEMFPETATVACQGIPGSYSEAAAARMFRSPQIMYFNSFEKVCSAVEKGLCRYGILPVENSNYGSIGMTYDLMRDHSFYIVRSTKHLVNHKLLAKPGTKLQDIKEIVSHEQALGQCREFIGSLDDVIISGAENTAVAARLVSGSDRKDIAAISSAECANLYGLEIIADDIQISDHNFTRFICISKELEIYPGDNRISLMLKVAHKPMSLYHTLGKISTLGINICKLESRPIPGSDFDFLFYFDLDGTIADPKIRKVLAELEKELDYFVFLGAYPEV